MAKLHKGDTVGLISCGDGLSNESKAFIDEIEEVLKDMGLKVKYAKTVYRTKRAFDKIKGIILGCFTEMEEKNHVPDVLELIKEVLGDRNIPIVKTSEIGHCTDSKCIIIGEEISLKI